MADEQHGIKPNSLYSSWSAAALLGITRQEIENAPIKPLQGRNGHYLGRDLLQWWRSCKP